MKFNKRVKVNLNFDGELSIDILMQVKEEFQN